MLATAGNPEIITDVRADSTAGQFARAEATLQSYQASHGWTPEALEALSWLGRDALAANQFDKADDYARRTYALSKTELKKRPLDAEPHLPLALGAAIEVHAQVMQAQGDRGSAVAYLHRELAAFGGTSIRSRIQKNLNLIELVGKTAPALDERHWLGPQPPTLASLRGHPVLLFFWAHWCGDCKMERRDISEIRREFGPQGLRLLMPTQHYGYVARGEEAPPAVETQYIDEVRKKYYLDLADVPVPLSEENFRVYGASTMPTIVLIDRHGVVRLFRPGRVPAQELRAAVKPLIASR